MNPKSSTYIKQVEKMIEAHLAESDFDVERLSVLLHVHRSQLYRKIHRLTGKNPSQLILEARMRKAKYFLLHTEKTIGEIAYDLGFADPAHFTKTFKKAIGTTPSQFRESNNSD